MKKRLIVILLAVLVTATLSACNRSDTDTDQAKKQRTSVETAQVQKGDLIVDKTIYGRMKPSKMTPVTIPSPGKTESLQVTEGDHVKKDDVLFTLSTPAGKQSITSPEDGVVSELKAEDDAAVSNEDPVAMIADQDTMIMEMSVTSAIRKHFKKDDTYDIRFQGKKYSAKIKTVGAMPGDDGLYKVKAGVDNDEETFIAGDIAELKLPVKKVTDTFIVPTSALVEKDGQTYVYVVKKDIAHEVKVKVEETQSDKSAVKADIDKGDQIIIDGQLTITDQSKVKATEGQE